MRFFNVIPVQGFQEAHHSTGKRNGETLFVSFPSRLRGTSVFDRDFDCSREVARIILAVCNFLKPKASIEEYNELKNLYHICENIHTWYNYKITIF